MDIIINDNRLLEEILDLLETNGYIVEEEIDKVYIRKESEKSFTEVWNEAEELHCSLRELNDKDLLDCREVLIKRANKIMQLTDS